MGLKVTLMVQEFPAATLAPQLFVDPKLAEVEIPPITKAALPVLVRVTGIEPLVVPTAWDVEKFTLAGERLAMGTVTPVPLRVIVCGLLAALSVTVTDPTAAPEAVGPKVTLIRQVAWAAMGELQVLLTPKPVVAVMDAIDRGAEPMLVRLTVWGELTRLTVWDPKASTLVESDTDG